MGLSYVFQVDRNGWFWIWIGRHSESIMGVHADSWEIETNVIPRELATFKLITVISAICNIIMQLSSISCFHPNIGEDAPIFFSICFKWVGSNTTLWSMMMVYFHIWTMNRARDPWLHIEVFSHLNFPWIFRKLWNLLGYFKEKASFLVGEMSIP